MARNSTGERATGIGSATLPIGSLYGVAASGCNVRQIGLFNTTAIACVYELVRLTSTGTQGAGLVEAEWDEEKNAPQCLGFNTHTANPGLGKKLGILFTIGAAIGAGHIETFGDSGIVIPKGVANGLGIILKTGTGQILDFYFHYDE